MGKIRALCAALCAFLLAIAAAAPAAAQVEEFYKGKTVSFIVGYPPGGGYDVYARLLARFMSDHMPGRPTIVVQNMPGAASLTATNHLYNVAARDGTVIGAFDRYMPLMALLGAPNVKFEPEKFVWLGSLSNTQDDAFVLWARKDATVKKVEDLRIPGGPELTVGTTAAGATDNDIGVLLREALRLNLKIISGYPSTTEIALAVERGELDGQLIGYVSTKVVKPAWTEPQSDMRVLLQFARTTRLPELPDAPMARELASDDRTRAIIDAAELPYQLARPVVAPPGVPQDRARALQTAFRDTTSDPAFLAEAKKLKLEISPVRAEEAERLIVQLAKTPADVLQQLRDLR
jgi:tripartite-type tricarboxylate transporter receptor subunit TctC